MRQASRVAWLAALALALGACMIAATKRPPEALRLDPFYTQYLAVEGIPIIASSRVHSQALLAVRSMAEGMLSHRPDLASVLAERGYRIAVMAPDEDLLDLPEMRHWRKPARDDPRLTRCELKHYDERIGRLSDRQY